MAVKRGWIMKMADKMFKIFVALNVLCQICPCRTSVDMHGQSFIQTDNELRYVVDAGSAFHITPGQGIHELSLASSLVRFEPSLLDFGDQPVGMPRMEQVTVQNLDSQTSLHLLSISGSTSHFHCSFFLDKLVPPLSNTTFEVVFLARQVGSIENTLYIHSSKGSFKYQVMGVGIHNPYRIRPFLGAKVPVNSSFSPVINMYNPHGTILQVEEIYTSGGDLHLELPTGEREASRELWEIPPFETKSIMKASFVGRVENNHTAFIRIRTNKDDKQQMLIVPVEVEVTSAPGLFSLLEMLDFGLLRTMDEPVTLRLNVINSGSKPLQIVNITVQPPNPAIRIEFRPVQIKPDIFHPTSVASISFTASEVLSLRQCSGKIVVKSKNSQHKLTVPYQATVLHGSLVYDRNQTLFYTGASRTGVLVNTTHNVAITNTFNVTVVVYNITLPATSRHLFTITNFSWPCMLRPQQTVSLFNLSFHPNVSMLHLTTDVYLHTNMSVFKIPLSIYHGRLKVVHHRPEIFKGQLDFGTLAMGEKRTMNFTLRNDNPVDIVISKFSANMAGAVVRLLGVERGNATTLSRVYDITSFTIDPLILKPFHIAVFSVELTAPDMEGAFAAEVIFTTQFEYLYIPITMRTAEGSLNVLPDKLVFKKCFPGRVSSLELRVHSTFAQTLEARGVTFSPNDTRFSYVAIKDRPVLQANQDTLVGHIYFDPRKECRDDCYVSLPTHIPAGHTWLLGSTLDHEVTDTDQYLYTRFQQKWDELGTSQFSTINVTVQLDTNKVRGFLFPAQAQLFWPSLTRKARIKFPLTQIGNTSMSEFNIENPSDVPVVVQLLPLSVYPNAQTLLDTIVPSLLPPDIMPDLIISDPDEPESDVFTLPDLVDLPPLAGATPPLPPGSGSGGGNAELLAMLRKAAETTLAMRPHRRTIALLMQARSKVIVRVNFQPKDDLPRTSVFIVRNNLTIIDAVVVQGQGGYGDFKFSNRKPGSQKPLMFEMTEKHLKSCDKRAHSSSRSVAPSFTVKRTFTARNSGQLPIYIHSLSIGSAECEGYGFKVLDCSGFELLPNDSHKVDIVFAPDFTMSRIRQTLTLQTSLGSTPLNFTLQATIPPHMLSLCASTLPRPSWEPLLYYAAVLSMGFLLFCVMVAAYLEADRISVAEAHRRRAELSHASAVYDRSKVFDLRAINSRQSLCHSPVYESDSLRGASFGSTMSTLLPSKSRQSPAAEVVTNGHTGINSLVRPTLANDENYGGRRGGNRFSLIKRLLGTRPPSPRGTTADRTPSPDVACEDGVKHATATGGLLGGRSASPSSSAKRRGLLSRSVGWIGGVSCGAVNRVVRRLVSVVGHSRFAAAGKPAVRDNASVELSRETGAAVGSVSGSTGGKGSESDAAQPAMVSASVTTAAAKSETKGSHARRGDKSSTGLSSSSAGNILTPSTNGDEVVHQKAASHGGGAGKQSKLRKPKGNDLRRLKEKLLEAEKEKNSTTIIDKDDSSSTTTETSSIEADDKNPSPREPANETTTNNNNNKSKKSTSAARSRAPVATVDVVAKSTVTVEGTVEPAPQQPQPGDEFIPATSKAKGHKKNKVDNNTASAIKSSALELPYMIKRGSETGSNSSTAPAKDPARPKQALSPPPVGASVPAVASTAGVSGNNGGGSQRKKVTKSKSSDGSTGRSEPGNRGDRGDSLWDMPAAGSRHVGDLGDLAAQTDAFAKSHRLGSGGSKDGSSSGSSPSGTATPPALAGLISPPNRSSSYSSIVSSAATRAKSPDQSSMSTMSTAHRHSNMAGVTTSPGTPTEIPAVGRRSPGSNPMMASATSNRPLVSNRPVAAVGATVRRSWTTGNYPGAGNGPDDLLMGPNGAGGILSAQCRQPQSPPPLMTPQYATGQPLILPDVNEVMMMGGAGMTPGGGCYLQGPMMCDDNLLSGYPVVNPNHMMYPMIPTETGLMDPACLSYGPPGVSMIPEQATTFMQKLQLDRRRRLYEYQQRKRLENAAEHWPGFDATIPEPVDSIWERPLSPGMWGTQPGANFSFAAPSPNQALLQQQPISGGGKVARPSSTDIMWNSPSSAPPTADWGSNSSMYGIGIWGSDMVSNDGRAPSAGGDLAEDGSTGTAAIFDPFNSLEMNKSIWNPNSTGGSSGVSGWNTNSSSATN